MIRLIFSHIILILVLVCNFESNSQNIDYTNYHQSIIQIENLIAEEKFPEALTTYDTIFEKYTFVFVKDYKIAAQLAILLNKKEKAKYLIKKGIAAGWEMKDIKRNALIKPLKQTSDWIQIKGDYKQLHKNYLDTLDKELIDTVKKMYSKDQWKAFGALFRFTSKAQDRYAEKKFAPHSNKQVTQLINIFSTQGYPGEKLIGKDYWTSTILSHHNSISKAHSEKDTLYKKIKPYLIKALKLGEISPQEFATIDEWYLIVKNDNRKSYYGILETPNKEELEETNNNRTQIGLRSIQTRNKLIELQETTEINFYLNGDPW